MERCFFASDLHGRQDRYEKLFTAMAREVPDAVLLGGDLLPGLADGPADRPFLEFTTPFSIYRVFDAISENLKALRVYRAETWEHLSQLATSSGFDSGQVLALERSFHANDQLLARWIGE